MQVLAAALNSAELLAANNQFHSADVAAGLSAVRQQGVGRLPALVSISICSALFFIVCGFENCMFGFGCPNNLFWEAERNQFHSVDVDAGSSAVRQQFVSSSSAVRQQFVSSSSAVRQQFVSSLFSLLGCFGF